MDTQTDLTNIINHTISNSPRSLQTRIGPSELGMECDRCLILKLAGLAPEDGHTSWLPAIGTAVHEWLETVIVRHLITSGSDRWLPEAQVTVGNIGNQIITGHSDLYDAHTGTIVDYKVVGTSTLKQTRRDGPKLTYQRQAHLYGLGHVNAGRPVNTVAIWYLPRNGFTINDGLWWETPYDQATAEQALARANMFTTALNAYGPDEVLFSAGPHAGTEFSCPDPDSDIKTAKQLSGLLTP